MSKGHTRRPSAVGRSEWESQFDRIFAVREPDSEPEPDLSYSSEPAHLLSKVRTMDPCDIADTPTPYFDDQRSRA